MQQNLLYRVDSFNQPINHGINPAVITPENEALHQTRQATLLYARTSQIPAPDYLQHGASSNLLSQAVTAHGGVVLQMEHNMITALFMQNGRDDSAHRAVSAALALIDQTMTANEYRLAAGSTAVRLGIGLSTGPVSLQHEEGALQFANKTGYQMLEAARQLSDLNQQTPFPAAFISHETFDALLPAQEWHFENLGSVWLPDQGQPQTVHAVMRAFRVQ